MAVPTGDYEVEVSVDLSPTFGKVETRECIRIVQPGPDALDKALALLDASEEEGLWEAVEQLQWFTQEGDRVVPALIGIVRTEDHVGRYVAVYGLTYFPAHRAEILPALLPLLGGKDTLGCAAAHTLANLFPKTAPLATAYDKAYQRAQFSLVEKAGRAIRRLLTR